MLEISECLVVAAYTFIQNGVCDGADQIAVVVRTAQTLSRQRGGADHDNIGQMAEIMVSHLVFAVVEGQEKFLVAGNVRVAEQCAVPVVLVCGAGSIEGVFREVVRHRRGKEVDLAACLFHTRINEQLHEIEQITGQVSNITGHDQSALTILLVDLLRFVIQNLCVGRLVDQKNIFL